MLSVTSGEGGDAQTADQLFATPSGRDRDARRAEFIVMTVEAATRAAELERLNATG
ncbi:hypothetical protein HYG77_01645 [Rhodococcus sp. ZPP]|uniref:hypothetical protein n=1 Tax=Rhodococcus sp. ZPP TaxID=2749906 RepID=UPI001AD872DB|nr:hypothetical protein [Rhodococcus sp. ZPP]QTJ64430.1 hypothetical protein HYG77_01645 [Rhodococcus sp. ZPP]